MSVPPVPPPLDKIGSRPFSFYPPIIGVEHNEWALRRATWSEFLVQNPASNQELWIPRRFVGELSRVDEPVMIVGLNRELELRGGMVLPHERRVISMPVAGEQQRDPNAPKADERKPAPMVNIRLEGTAENRIGRLLVGVVAFGILACVIFVLMMRDGQRIAYQPVVQSELGFTANDDYWSVVNRLGKPAEDRWRSSEGEIQYRLLGYPDKNLFIVLMGPDRKDMHYVGAFDRAWHVVHSSNPDTGRVLKTLQRF